MDRNKTLKTLEALASGRSPITGEMLVDETILNDIVVIRALQMAIEELKKMTNPVLPGQKKAKDEKPKEIDYFRKPKFNALTESEIAYLKEQIEQIGILKTQNLSENIIKARILFPRAYESWSTKEKELFSNAMEFTNDLTILSDCFQRGQGSLETVGQKLLYASKQ